MEIKWQNRILVRISILFLGLTALFLLLLCLYNYSTLKGERQQALQQLARATSTRLALTLGPPLSRRDDLELQVMVDAEMTEAHLAGIIVRGLDKSVLLARRKGPQAAGGMVLGEPRNGDLRAVENIVFENRVLGRIELYVLPDFGLAEVKRAVVNLGLVAAGLIALAFLALFTVLKKSLLLPVLELARATENISLGRVDQAIVIRSKDELGQLAAAIERMRISIRIAIERLASKKGALPGVEAGEWEDVILEKKQYGFEFLALRILVGRLTVSYRNDPTAETLRKCTQHLINFFQNEKNPQAQKDLTKIFGGAVL